MKLIPEDVGAVVRLLKESLVKFEVNKAGTLQSSEAKKLLQSEHFSNVKISEEELQVITNHIDEHNDGAIG